MTEGNSQKCGASEGTRPILFPWSSLIPSEHLNQRPRSIARQHDLLKDMMHSESFQMTDPGRHHMTTGFLLRNHQRKQEVIFLVSLHFCLSVRGNGFLFYFVIVFTEQTTTESWQWGTLSGMRFKISHGLYPCTENIFYFVFVLVYFSDMFSW